MKVLYTSETETTGGTETATATAAAPPPAETKDPYEGLSPEERAIAEEADTFERELKGLTPQQKVLVKRYALQKDRELQEEAERKAKEGEKKPDEPEESDPIKKEIAELKAWKKSQEDAQRARIEQEKLAEAGRKLNSTIDAELKKIDGLDDDDREALSEAYLGHYLKHRPGDLSGSVKRYADKWMGDNGIIAKVAKKRFGTYVDGKVAAAEATKGETKRGGAPGEQSKKYTRKDLESGKLIADIKKKLGEE